MQTAYRYCRNRVLGAVASICPSVIVITFIEIIGKSVMLNEAKTSKPRPELRGRGQDYEVETKADWPKIIMKMYKIPEFYTIFARKMPDYIIIAYN